MRKSKSEKETNMVKSKVDKKVEKDEKIESKENNAKLQAELDKIGSQEQIFEPSEDNPDNYKDYPRLIVCSTDPARYVYPMMIMLENNEFIRLQAMNNYVSTVLRIMELFNWCLTKRIKRKRLVEGSNGKKLVVNEYILKKLTPI